jgi:hypothetical protein
VSTALRCQWILVIEAYWKRSDYFKDAQLLNVNQKDKNSMSPMFGDKYSKVATYVSTDSSGTTTLQQEGIGNGKNH